MPAKTKSPEAQPPSKLAGVSLSLRSKYLDDVLAPSCPLDWLELLADNWIHMCGPDQRFLQQVCERYTVTLHSVGMNIGGTDKLNLGYLNKLCDLRNSTNACVISDHLCFSTINNHRYHDLLPLPLNEETLDHIAPRISLIQDLFQSPLLIENAASYFRYRASDMSEATFLNQLCKRTGCRLLLDINNIFVSATNLGMDAKKLISDIDTSTIEMIHLGGHHHQGTLLVDSHSARISKDVWELFHFQMIRMLTPTPVVIEWDNDLPSFSELIQERDKAITIISERYEPAFNSASL